MFGLKSNWLLVTLLYAHTAFSVIWLITAPLGTVWESTDLIDTCPLSFIAIIPSGNYGAKLKQHTNRLKRICRVGGHDSKEGDCFSVCLGERLKKCKARSLATGSKLLLSCGRPEEKWSRRSLFGMFWG